MTTRSNPDAGGLPSLPLSHSSKSKRMFDGRNLDYQSEEVFATVIEEFDSKGVVSEIRTSGERAGEIRRAQQFSYQ